MTIFFAEQRRSVLTRKSIARDFDRISFSRPSCGTRFFGDVELGDDLDPRGDLFLDDDRRLRDLDQAAVQPVADPVEPLEGLEVNVRGAGGNGVEQDLLDVADHRRIVDFLARFVVQRARPGSAAR